MLGGRRLFGTKNPVRLLQNSRPRVAQEGPRVLMANGDVIPGRITGFLPASAANDAPARLLISLDAPLLPAAGAACPCAESVLRVATATDATGSGQPGSLVLANGTRLQARAMRWTEQGLSALTAGGFTAVAFDAIADFSVPKVDVVRAVLDDSSYPPFGPDTVVGRLETFEGAVLTYACEMTLAGVGLRRPRPAICSFNRTGPQVWFLCPSIPFGGRASARPRKCRSPCCRRKRCGRRSACTAGPGGGTRTWTVTN